MIIKLNKYQGLYCFSENSKIGLQQVFFVARGQSTGKSETFISSGGSFRNAVRRDNRHIM